MDLVNIAEAVGEALKGHTQDDVADRMNAGKLELPYRATQARISRWKNGEVVPSPVELAALEDACGRQRGFVLRLAGLVEDAKTVRSAIESDPNLDDISRTFVLEVYDVRVKSTKQSRR